MLRMNRLAVASACAVALLSFSLAEAGGFRGGYVGVGVTFPVTPYAYGPAPGYRLPPSAYGYPLDDYAGGYYGGGRYREYYAYGRGVRSEERRVGAGGSVR